ncbi:hypothetical protein [Brachybacterium sp. AOP3-A1-3]|uniref:hypothetical protein n=1 Tax=Brachybacterium sp. AOP3-A1-3 TaxID=3457699 RepID=UPI004034EC57
MKKIVGAAVAVSLVVVIGMVAGVTAMFFQFTPGASSSAESSNPACTAGSAPALTVEADALPSIAGYTPEQLSAAAQIMKAGSELGLPERAQLIGLMTAMQESTLQNLSGGDRDSVGLFQQRPSQGWGTVEQLRDPSYAATAFFRGVDTSRSGHISGLVDIEGWESMSLTQAASAVQLPAEQYEGEYAKHESEARKLMSELAGVPVGQASGSLTDTNLGCSAPVNVAVGDLPTQEQLTQDSANVACPEGTTDLGAATGGYQGKRIPIRLCSITGTVCTGSDCRDGELGGIARGEVVVNSLVAPHLMKWLEAVRADGYNPQFSSSFRSWETQASFSGGNVARVGYSNHQMGAAIDISGLPGGYNRHNCAGFAADGSCKSNSLPWSSYHKHGVENGALFHDEEFWHLEWVITRAHERDVPFISAA